MATIDLSFEIIPSVSGTTIYVPTDFPTIQEAVDAANDGDTVYVYSGTYNENIWIDTSITLIGQNKDTTIIEGVDPTNSAVVEIHADWVNVIGFTVSNSAEPYRNRAGIYLHYTGSDNATISNNIIKYISWGIEILNSNSKVENNTIYSNSIGIFLLGVNNIILNNNLFNNNDGIYVEGRNHIIEGNMISSHNYSGITLDHSLYNEVYNNNISNSDAIYIGYSDHNNINNNIISNNDWGFWIQDSDDNNMEGNTIYMNTYDGIRLDSSNDNNIVNNFVSTNNRYGIYLYWNSNDNIISNNNISQSQIGIYNYRSSRNSISGNNMTDNGFFIDGINLDEWNTHNIDTANTIDGKPLYYYKNENGIIVPNGGSQIILANCTNTSIQNENLNNSYAGIEFGFSSSNKIINSSINNAKYGIYFHSSKNNTILNSSISNSYYNDFYLKWDSHIISLNTHFNESKPLLYDSKSSLTVKWFLNVNVTDYMGIPVPNANVKIEDNTNGTYDTTYVTDGNGYLRWIPLTEYIKFALGKTYYTPHKIVAWNNTLVGYAQPFMNESKTVTIVLYNGTLLDLEPGWNLVSLPRIQSDTNLPTILQSIEGQYDAVQWYDVTDSTDPWKHHHISKLSNLNDLNKINHTKGIWVHVTDPEGTTLVVFGDELATNQNIPLYPGWNHVGYPSKSNKTRDAALNNLFFDTEIDAIWTYNATTQKWNEITASDYFEVGRGYWIHSKVTKIWIIPL
jgi:parallel beta-helix repeat protein